MAEAFATRLSSRDEAMALVDRFLETRDDALLAPVVRGMAEGEDEDVFAVMRGSDNDMSPLSKALYLMRKAGLLDMDDTMGVIDRWRDARDAAR